MKKNKKKIIIILIILIILIIIGSFIFFNVKKSKNNSKGITTTVQSKNLQEKIYLSGSLNASSKAKVSFISDSKITWIGVKEGDEVKKFQGLAKQDTSEVEKSLKLSLNSYLSTRWDFDKTTQDNKYLDQADKTMARDMKLLVDKAQLSLDDSVIDVDLKNMAIKKSYLSSPIKGIVTKAPTSQTGSYPNADDYFEIVDPATEYISAMVGQQDVIKLKVGQKAKITLDSYRELPFEATVNYISYNPVDTTNNKYEVKLIYTRQPEKYNYHLGMTGEIEVLLSEKNDALVLPRQYISSDMGKRFVTITNNNSTEKREVTTGMENYEEIEILSGLKVGDTVSYSK
ncbi:MAG: efflux RND transporter periplasmic adaptor subunit [Candidatus Shapirobacteria bacterium]|nr:efflux RND transporter periplasmic adaptor subunit [Candidatus Shapirobacteria bacterium]MDD4382592.1 efflux RND transporter periplasmic adaptor subunit [Candidatus Shapirobacteria bacterium]